MPDIDKKYKDNMLVLDWQRKSLHKIVCMMHNDNILMQNMSDKKTYLVDIDVLYECYEPYETESSKLLYE